ncbi:MAG TPA: excalibur calcium-binding domain-containing protein, partial [Micromonosporaceae bacterium]|nr:excalibur calcium-binding domain-containing protein [Micromonosporaceae bacterium]
PLRAAGVVRTAVAALLFFVFALFAADSQPIGPDAPFGALPPTASPDVTPASAPPVGPTPDAGGAAPDNRYPGALPPPVSASRTLQPAAAQPAAPRPAAPEPRPESPQDQPPPEVPHPAPAPAVPEPGPQAPAPQPSAPQPQPSTPSHPAPPTPQRPDDGTPPGNGNPKGNPSPPGHEPKANGPKIDPRYASCDEVLAADLGPYKAGRDDEYGWYPDPDADGWACEQPRLGLGRK